MFVEHERQCERRFTFQILVQCDSVLCLEVFVFLDVGRTLFIAAIHFGDADVITFAFDRTQFMYVVGSNKRAVMLQRESVLASTLVSGYMTKRTADLCNANHTHLLVGWSLFT